VFVNSLILFDFAKNTISPDYLIIRLKNCEVCPKINIELADDYTKDSNGES